MARSELAQQHTRTVSHADTTWHAHIPSYDAIEHVHLTPSLVSLAGSTHTASSSAAPAIGKKVEQGALAQARVALDHYHNMDARFPKLDALLDLDTAYGKKKCCCRRTTSYITRHVHMDITRTLLYSYLT